MQEDKIEQDRGKSDTEENQKRIEGKRKQKVKEIERRIRKN